ncbi:hypothetical protein BG011_009610 [Mortierella polycephala]|uniref:Extracellular membrane protein CFEM domain-containing protein n=1 Tax=Mortierella polycephala TaxID=41804 RepID=A0A9P6PLX9_9FUNG|nr:hypothetical protein BG011_009610 [Mortierella polycephala]
MPLWTPGAKYLGVLFAPHTILPTKKQPSVTMKLTFLSAAALAMVAVVAGQEAPDDGTACTLCLQNSLRALPLCKDIDIVVGEFNPGVSPDYASCLCSSLDGAWVDACADTTKCGADIMAFKDTYAANIKEAGLQCDGPAPTFVPKEADPIAPSSTGPNGSAPTGDSGNPESFGIKGTAPTFLLAEAMGLLGVVVAVGTNWM